MYERNQQWFSREGCAYGSREQSFKSFRRYRPHGGDSVSVLAEETLAIGPGKYGEFLAVLRRSEPVFVPKGAPRKLHKGGVSLCVCLEEGGYRKGLKSLGVTGTRSRRIGTRPPPPPRIFVEEVEQEEWVVPV